LGSGPRLVAATFADCTAPSVLRDPPARGSLLAMTLPGSQAALRGYRLQHLYTLHRLFGAGADDLVIQLEGSEDVDILDRSGNLVEAVQVKALAGNVTASSLRSEDDSFYRRADARLVAHPRAIQKVVSFGPFGPELAGCRRSPQSAENVTTSSARWSSQRVPSPGTRSSSRGQTARRTWVCGRLQKRRRPGARPPGLPCRAGA